MHASIIIKILVVTLFWAVLGTAGCLPFLFSPALELSITDAVFESLSGLTTTGATVISGLDSLPKSILFYRQQLQWLGGMGIIVLAISLLPMLGIGGMQLYRAESPGPVKDNKLLPRLAETAKALWFIYLSLTAVCAVCSLAAKKYSPLLNRSRISFLRVHTVISFIDNHQRALFLECVLRNIRIICKRIVSGCINSYHNGIYHCGLQFMAALSSLHAYVCCNNRCLCWFNWRRHESDSYFVNF